MMYTNCENIGGINYHTITGKTVCPEYMKEMLIISKPEMIIPMTVLRAGDVEKAYFKTDIGTSLKNLFSENGANDESIRSLLYAIDGVLAVCGEYLLERDFIVMNTEAIFNMGEATGIQFIFNPFLGKDFKKSCKDLLADILGNYFTGYSITSEKLREQLLREINKKEFCPRNLLSKWGELTEEVIKEDVGDSTTQQDETPKNFIKLILDKFNKPAKNTNETFCLSNTEGNLCLTGICSINTKIPISSEGTTVGRSMLQKEFGLYNSGIGKTHARVYEKDGNIYATDLGSRNGTYLNGERLDKREPVKIERGDILAFSDEEFILC